LGETAYLGSGWIYIGCKKKKRNEEEKKGLVFFFLPGFSEFIFARILPQASYLGLVGDKAHCVALLDTSRATMKQKAFCFIKSALFICSFLFV